LLISNCIVPRVQIEMGAHYWGGYSWWRRFCTNFPRSKCVNQNRSELDQIVQYSMRTFTLGVKNKKKKIGIFWFCFLLLFLKQPCSKGISFQLYLWRHRNVCIVCNLVYIVIHLMFLDIRIEHRFLCMFLSIRSPRRSLVNHNFCNIR